MDMICLDLHDFSVVNNRLLWLRALKDHFEDFKVSLFTVPIDTKQDWGPYTIRQEFLKEIKKDLDWIQIIPHGFAHKGSEAKNWTYQETIEKLSDIKIIFDNLGLPFEKGFCAPHWRWNSEVVRALDDSGWWGAIDPRQPNMLKTKTFYRYSHTIDSKLPDEDGIKLHGHIYGTPNDIGRCFDNLLTLPLNTEWSFITNFLEEYDRAM